MFRYCILAEDVRLEQNGKSSLIGFLGLSPFVEIGVPFPDQPLPHISFLFMTGEAVPPGRYVIRLTITDPAGKMVGLPSDQVMTPDRRAPLGVIFQAQPLSLRGVGKYGLALTINGQPDLHASFANSRRCVRRFLTKPQRIVVNSTGRRGERFQFDAGGFGKPQQHAERRDKPGDGQD